MSIKTNGDVVTKLQADVLALKAEVVALQTQAEQTRKNQSVAVKEFLGDLDRPWGDLLAHVAIVLNRIEELLGEEE